MVVVPPSGGSLEIGNSLPDFSAFYTQLNQVPPSGGSLEIGNIQRRRNYCSRIGMFPLRGDP